MKNKFEVISYFANETQRQIKILFKTNKTTKKLRIDSIK